MFRYAGGLLYKSITPVTFQDNPSALGGKVDALIYPTANIVSPTAELGGHGRFFDALSIPFAVLGVGIQSALEDPTNVSIKLASQEFFKVLARKSPATSVRGPTTQAVLRDLFGANCLVTGCPSNFLSPLPDEKLAAQLKSRFDGLKSGARPLVRVAVHPQHGTSYYTEAHAPSERYLFRLALSGKGYSYVCNGPVPIFSLARNRLYEKQYASEHRLLHNFLAPGKTPDCFLNDFRSVALAFGSLLSWLEFLSAQDLVIGKRVHACIAAMQCGVPTILIVHDSKTLELAQTIGIPHVPISTFADSDPSLEGLLATVDFSAEKYAAKRSGLRSALQKVLLLNGFPPMDARQV